MSPVDGALWIGGYDAARVADSFFDFPIYNQGTCVSCVVVTNISYLTDDGPVSLFSGAGEHLQVSLDPFTHGLEVPNNIFQNFMRATNGTVGTDPGITRLITLPVDSVLGNLSVTFSNGYETIIPSYELFYPPRQYATSGVYEISNHTYLISELVNTTTTDHYLPSWGTPFLTMNYMIMDYDNQTFRLAPAYQGSYGESDGSLIQPLCKGVAPVSTTAGAPSSTIKPASTTSSSSSATAAHSSHTNVGAIAGGVVGGVVGLAIIALLAFCLLRSRRRESALRQEQESVIASYVHPNDYKSQATSQVSDANQQEVQLSSISQVTNQDYGVQIVPSSPTEVSETEQRNISQWLYAQDHATTVRSLMAAKVLC